MSHIRHICIIRTLYCIICASSLQREELIGPPYPPFTPHSSILLPASSQRTQYSSGSLSVLFNCGLRALCAGGPRTEEKYFLTSRPAPFYFLFRFSQCSNCKPGTSSPSSLPQFTYNTPPSDILHICADSKVVCCIVDFNQYAHRHHIDSFREKYSGVCNLLQVFDVAKWWRPSR